MSDDGNSSHSSFQSEESEKQDPSPSSTPKKRQKPRKSVSFGDKNQIITLPNVIESDDDSNSQSTEGKQEMDEDGDEKDVGSSPVSSRIHSLFKTPKNDSRDNKTEQKKTNGGDSKTQTKDERSKYNARVDIEITSRQQIKDHLQQKKKNSTPAFITALEVGNLTLAAKYVLTDTKKHKSAWVIGFFTVFIVVFFTSLLQNSIDKSPIVFLKLSEDQVGEYDLLLSPNPTSTSPNFWLNSTDIDLRIKDAPMVVGAVPRWVFLGKVNKPSNPTYNTSTAILIIDSEQESEIGLGRGWTHPELGRDEAHVSSSVLRALGIEANAGETIMLTIDFISVLQSAGALPGGFDGLVRTLLVQNGINLTISFEQFIPILEQTLGPLGVNVTALLNQIFGGDYNYNLSLQDILVQALDGLRQNLIIQREYLVIDAIDSPKGKYPKAIGNVLLLESKYIKDLVVELVTQIKDSGVLPNGDLLRPFLQFFTGDQRAQLQEVIDTIDQFNTDLDNFEENFEINDYALSVVVMYKDRFKTYVKSLKKMNLDLIAFTNQVADAIGYNYPASFSLPLQAALQPLYFIRLFLDQIFTFVVVTLIGLGGLLIYSLLLSNVEEKTYEYGMLRALGMKQYVLIELLTMQSLSFSIPGIIIGLLVSFLCFIPIAKVIADFALSPRDITFGSLAIALGVLLGLFMPFIALIGPIRRALSRTLRDALDIYHQVQSETTVRIIKLEKLGLSPWQIAASLMMIIMGFIVYYLIPYTFTFGNLPLFFLILTFILIGMLFGLSLIGMTLQPYSEKLAVYFILWGRDYRSLSGLVRKNLSSHSRRNIKTAIMFTTSLAFIIFAGSSFSLQGHTIAETVRLASGGDITVISFTTALNDKDLRSYLSAEMEKGDPLVLGFTFATGTLDDTSYIYSTRLSNLASFPTFRVDVYAVEENYLDETYSQFYRPTELDKRFTYLKTPDGKDDAIKSLYRDAGKAQLPQEENGIEVPPDITSNDVSNETKNYNLTAAYHDYIDVIVSEALRDSGSIDVHTPLRLSVGIRMDTVNITFKAYLCKPRALIGALPGFFFSSYRQTASGSNVMITMDQYYRLLSEAYNTSTNPRPEPLPAAPEMYYLRVKVKANPTKLEREAVINGVRNFITDDLIQVIDSTDVVDSTKDALNLLTLFFNIVSIIAVVLCFFVLWLSFTANVNENSWEFGVLRALGLSASAVIRMYIYEALCLISSSVIIGAAIGLLVSITLTLQFNLFTELAFTFDFPYILFFSVFGMSILVSIVGSWSAAWPLKKKEVAIALKNM